MATYIYRERCTWQAKFDASSDEAAEQHVLGTFRSHDANPDFDGDAATLFRLDWDDEDEEFIEASVGAFDGENMIEEIGH